MKKIKFIILALSLLMILSQQGVSQDLIRTNPADIADPQALFINPALLPYQNLSFNLGMKIYHVGFLDENSVGLRHSYSSNSFPNVLLNGVGIGVTLQNFDSPYHSDTGLGISLGYSILPSFSLGFSLIGSNFHLDADKMQGIDPNDPLLNRLGKWYVSYGAGLFFRPNEKFSAGLGLNNINRPSKSFEKDNSEERNRVPFEMDFGFKYSFNKIFAFSVFSHLQKFDFAPGIAAETNIDNNVLIRTGYVDRCAMFEGLIHISNGFGITYRLDYPVYEVNKVSYGSHQLGLTWNMKFNPDYTFNIQVSEDTVRVMKEYNKIKISKKEDREKLFENLDDIDLQFPDLKKTTEQIETEPPKSGMALDDIGDLLPHNNQLDAYKDNFTEIKDYVKSTNKDFAIDIYYPDATTAERAMVIKNYLIDSLQFNDKNIKLHKEANGNGKTSTDDLQITKKDSIQMMLAASDDRFGNSEYLEISSPPIEKLIPAKVFFHILNAKFTRVSKWRILITNSLGDPMHEISGYNNIENLVEWDCFKDDGTLLNVGNYYYQFQYSVGGGWIPKKPNRYPLTFIRVTRAKTIEITTDAINNLKMLKEVIIRLKEPNGYEQIEPQE
jgi:hypothetical protein